MKLYACSHNSGVIKMAHSLREGCAWVRDCLVLQLGKDNFINEYNNYTFVPEEICRVEDADDESLLRIGDTYGYEVVEFDLDDLLVPGVICEGLLTPENKPAPQAKPKRGYRINNL